MATTTYWGMIGTGDVTEVKSGPAFQKVEGSHLMAVMSRDKEKVRDYANRHTISEWYVDADQVIKHPKINSIYIATPPDTHYMYAKAALQAGKDVYLEKPMTLDSKQAGELVAIVNKSNNKVSVAHYRREQPYFKKIKELIDQHAIGTPLLSSLQLFNKRLPEEALQLSKIKWRLDPIKSGGGLFYDLAPHQIDLMYYFFGEMEYAGGIAHNQTKAYPSNDVVSGQILFKNQVVFNGLWAFNVSEDRDVCEITGSEGKISFSIFHNDKVELLTSSGKQEFFFEPLTHVQQPMIEAVVAYFQDKRSNPCSVSEGFEVMKAMDSLAKTNNYNERE